MEITHNTRNISGHLSFFPFKTEKQVIFITNFNDQCFKYHVTSPLTE